MAQPVFITDAQVKSVLTWPLVIEAVEEAMKSIVNTERPLEENRPFACQPPRSFTFTENRSGVLLTMPGYVAGAKSNTLACKLVTSFPKNEQRQPPLPNILANILLFDPETGQLQCVMDGTQITAWRTAAASIVATKYLYFRRWTTRHDDTEKDRTAISLAIIGCGIQGESHSLGMSCTFNVTAIYLWNRTKAKADKLATFLDSQRSTFRNPMMKIIVTSDVSECVADADVIFIGTSSAKSLLDYEMLLKKPTIHINAVGAGQIHHGEVGQSVYDNAKTYIDFWAGAKIELKTLKADIVGEVGEVINTRRYPQIQGITIFQSMGMAVEDATVARAVHEALRNRTRDVL